MNDFCIMMRLLLLELVANEVSVDACYRVHLQLLLLMLQFIEAVDR